MNLKIKFRESFRPFAPAILEEKSKQYFDIEGTSPYMLLTCQVKGGMESKKIAVGEKWMQESLQSIQSEVPAVTHVDGSARVQTVDRLRNPHFHQLLESFYEETGSPVLINTSFNVRGEPIVCSPEDAIRCFIKSDIDVLVIGNYFVERTEQEIQTLSTLRNQFHAEDQFELD
jgi:carbamoyltransferase